MLHPNLSRASKPTMMTKSPAEAADGHQSPRQVTPHRSIAHPIHPPSVESFPRTVFVENQRWLVHDCTEALRSQWSSQEALAPRRDHHVSASGMLVVVVVVVLDMLSTLPLLSPGG